MRKGLITLAGATILAVGCADSGSLGIEATGPRFSHIDDAPECRAGEPLWVGTDPLDPIDENANGWICVRESPRRKFSYTDDVTHKERPRPIPGPPKK
jgi:hypothetical protein